MLVFANGLQLWRSDGTAAGTMPLRDLARNTIISVNRIKAVGERVFVSGGNPETGVELYLVSPPTASAGGAYAVNGGGTVSLSAAGSTDPDVNEVLTYRWDLDGDGRFGETGADAQRGDEVGVSPLYHAGSGGGRFGAKVRVYNSVGMWDEADAVVTVKSSALVGTAGDDQYVVKYVGGEVRFHDADDALIFTLPAASVGSVSLEGNGGNDGLRIERAAGGTAPVVSILTGNVRFEVVGDGVELSVASAARVTFAQPKSKLAKLTMQGNAMASVQPGGNRVLVLADLSISPDATLDLNDNDLILQPGPGVDAAALYQHVRARLGSGYAGGTWGGKGIVSTSAKEDLSGRTTLGLVRNSDDGIRRIHESLHGETLGPDDVLVRSTWKGDLDGDHAVDADDYHRMDSGFLARDVIYQRGNLDWDGDVDLDDYLVLDQGYLGVIG